jgi:hypothetical protein
MEEKYMLENFICYYHFISWWHWSLGVHVDPWHPQIEIHLPFGFVRLGYVRKGSRKMNVRTFGKQDSKNECVWSFGVK